MRIVFVRHGEPNYELDCLTENGKIHAAKAAERLKEEGIEEIWTSPYGRALQTAEVSSRVLGLPVKTLDFMHELNWGSIDGKPIFENGHPWLISDDMARRGMDLNDPKWRENEYFKNNRVVENVDMIAKRIDDWLSGYGYIRNGQYYNHTSDDSKHRTVAVFAHGGSTCAALAHILNMTFPCSCAMLHFEFTGITIVRLDRTAGPATLPILELCNDGRHIR